LGLEIIFPIYWQDRIGPFFKQHITPLDDKSKENTTKNYQKQ
jgi:hypothetical protein